MTTLKTLAEYAEAHRKDPFPFPMPDGETIEVPQPTIAMEHRAFTAAKAAGEAGGTYATALIAGLRTYVSAADGDRIEEAYGKLPAAVLDAVVTDMREHFGSGLLRDWSA